MTRKESTKASGVLLTIGEACRVLGVSEAALRQWTDEGKVKAFVTPGGHRRYSEAGLRLLLRRQPHIHGLRDLGERLEGVVSRERQAVQEYMHLAGWYQRLDGAAKDRLRERGRRLVSALARFVTRPPLREQVLEECRSIGREYGQDLAGLGLTLGEAVEAFVVHRSPISDAALDMLKDSALPNRAALAAIGQINHVVDQTLLALVETHQSVQATDAGGAAT